MSGRLSAADVGSGIGETYVITFEVRPEEIGRFRSLLDPVLDAMRHEATFVSASLHVDPDSPNVFQLHETWTDRADVLDVQLHRPYRAAWHAALDSLLLEPRDIRTWRMLRTDP